MSSSDDTLRGKVQQQFGEHAQNYVTSTVHGSGYSLERLLELLKVTHGTRAIDIATGGGHVALGLAKRGAQVIASDLTPKMLSAARPFINESAEKDQAAYPVRYAQVDAQTIPFADNTFDFVTCRIAPHHFPDVQKFVQEAARVVKKGGIVGIVDQIAPEDKRAADYLNAFEQLRDPSHVWEYSQADWEGFFSVADLQVTHRELCQNRLEFGWWTRMQNCTPDTVTRLNAMLHQTPQAVSEWLQPELPDVGGANSAVGAMYFSLWQLILIGVKT